jgi:hypothetical protein
MTTLPRFLLATGWGSVFAGACILTAYYNYKMDRNVAEGRNPYRGKGNGIHRLSFQYDPEDYTELGPALSPKGHMVGIFYFCVVCGVAVDNFRWRLRA